MQKTLDYNSRMKQLKLKTGLEIEKQEANAFTLKVFELIQDEIYNSAFSVLPINFIENECTKTYTLKEPEVDCVIKCPVVVVFGMECMSITCSCMRFEREGILCRHIFYVLRLNDINEIPKKYILLRWTKDIFTVSLAKLQHTDQQIDDKANKIESYMRQMYDDVSYCIQMLRGDDKGMEEAMKRIHEIREDITAQSGVNTLSKTDVLERLVGVPRPQEITVYAPEGIRNKGCGTQKRMISDRDSAIAKNSKALRRCKSCNELAHHDSRNCPLKEG